ncbi:TPA: MobH family relaxase [Pseudomonas aeruginosa]
MLAKALRSFFSFNRQQAHSRPISSGERPSPKSLTPDLLKMLEKGDEDALRYPPYIRGFPAFISGSVLLDYHKEKVGLIASGIGLPPKQFSSLILPVLESYANFVHLVPASQNHHHRAWGGLLAHGLEVALMALNSCQTTSFDHGRVPQDRTRRKERWYAAAVFASLLHDTGKPLSDFRITDESGEISWKPVSKSIPEWANEHGIERYFLHWNPGRHERHKNLSITMIDRILSPAVREWLMDGGQDLYTAMVSAITGDDEKSTLTGIIIKSDSQSVAQDLKKHGGDPAGAAAGGTGVPIASQVINAMRLLRQNGVWNANERGQRIWTTTQGVFVAWNAGVDEVVEKLLADGLKAFPRSADSLGQILADHDVFERNPNGSIYWKVAPDILSEGKEKVLRLQCVKLSSPSTIYPFDPVPAPVAVEIGDEKNAVRYDPANGGMGLALGEGAEGSGIDLSGGQLQGQGGEEVKPMFDLEGTIPTAAPPQEGNSPAGFSAPSLATKPDAGVSGKKGPAQGSKPTLALDPSPHLKPGLVIGTPSPAATSPSTQVQAPALSVGTGLFAGIKIGGDAPALEIEPKEPVKPAQQPVWEDPFAKPEMQLDGDPFATTTTVKSPISPPKTVAKVEGAKTPEPPKSLPQVPSSSAPKVEASVRQDEGGVRPTSPSASLQVGGIAGNPQQSADLQQGALTAPGHAPAREGFQTIEITADFDPEILELTGIDKAFADVPVITHVERDEGPSPEKSRPLRPVMTPTPEMKEVRREPGRKERFAPIPADAFEDEFRFDAEQVVLDESDVPAPPIENPLGISAPAELAGLDISSFSLQEAPQVVSLDGFDLPSLDSTVFIGGEPLQPIMQMGGSDDLECINVAEPESSEEDEDQDESTTAVGETGEPPAKKRRRRKKKKVGIIEPMPAMDLGTPVIRPVTPGITIGPERKSKPAAEAPARDTTEAPVSSLKHPPEEVQVVPQSDYHAFLNRHPDLATKFLWYTQNVDQGVRLYKRLHPLLLFREGGFQPDDVAPLNEARWLWFDFTAPERLVFSMLGDKGVVLIPYLVDALAALSEGQYQPGIGRPVTSLSEAEMARVAREALERVPVNTDSFGTPVAVFTPKVAAAVSKDLGIGERDLIRALIETQQVVLDRKNYVVRVEAKPVSYE